MGVQALSNFYPGPGRKIRKQQFNIARGEPDGGFENIIFSSGKVVSVEYGERWADADLDHRDGAEAIDRTLFIWDPEVVDGAGHRLRPPPRKPPPPRCPPPPPRYPPPP